MSSYSKREFYENEKINHKQWVQKKDYDNNLTVFYYYISNVFYNDFKSTWKAESPLLQI